MGYTERRRMSRGFTIIEIMVVVVIMAILGVAIALAYPHARAEQKLTLAEQTLQAALRAAQQAAINEERNPQCLTEASAHGSPPERCSDTGIVLCPTRDDMIVFADIFEPDKNVFESDSNCDSPKDFVIARIPFPDGVVVEPSTPPTVLLFEGAPPVIHLFSGTREVINSEAVQLRIGKVTRPLNVGSYGQVERP